MSPRLFGILKRIIFYGVLATFLSVDLFVLDKEDSYMLPVSGSMGSYFAWQGYQTRTLASSVDPRVSGLAQSLQDKSPKTVFSYVNQISLHYIRYASDWETYGWFEYFGTSTEALDKGAGDCDERAFFVAEVLREMGYDAGVYFSVVNYGTGNGGHAVAYVKHNHETWIIDMNLNIIYPRQVWLYKANALIFAAADEHSFYRVRYENP